MNILRRFNSTSSTTSLKPAIDAFISRVQNEQLHNSGVLLKNIDLLIDKHQPYLIEKFHLEPYVNDEYRLQQLIWDNLKLKRSESLDMNYRLRKELMGKKNHDHVVSYSKPYREFIKELYRVRNKKKMVFGNDVKYFDFISNYKKYLFVDHEELYKRYLDLPSPAPKFLDFNDLQAFIKSFFLINPTTYSNTTTFNDSKKINIQLNKRRSYHDMCAKVINDIKAANLPITQQEQIRLIYLSFYKDRQDLLHHLNHDELNYPGFKWTDYQTILDSFGGDQRRDILGVLLFLATRHDQFDIIEDILSKANLGYVINQSGNEEMKLVDISLIHLVSYFTQYITRPGYDGYLMRTVELLTRNTRVITTDIVNVVIKTLLDLGFLDDAKKLFEYAFFPQNNNNNQRNEEMDGLENVTYKNMTPEDRIINKEWLFIYTKLKTLTKDQEVIFKLIPTENSFLGFINEYCRKGVDFTHVKQMIYIMNNLAMFPLSTRIYSSIFTGFMNRETPWSLDDLVWVITRLVNDIDAHDSSSSFTSNNLEKLINEGSVNFDRNVLSSHGNSSMKAIYENNDIRILRLNNHLMDLIFTSVEMKLHNLKDGDAVNQLSTLKSTWKDMLDEQEKVMSVYYADRLAYVNRAVLFELFSIISKY